jgi:hypothetical protein
MEAAERRRVDLTVSYVCFPYSFPLKDALILLLASG